MTEAKFRDWRLPFPASETPDLPAAVLSDFRAELTYRWKDLNLGAHATSHITRMSQMDLIGLLRLARGECWAHGELIKDGAMTAKQRRYYGLAK